MAQVRGAHIQPGAGIGLIYHAEDALIFGDHRIHGEHFMAFAVRPSVVRRGVPVAEERP